MGKVLVVFAFSVFVLTAIVRSACVPEVPQKLLSDPAILRHPAIVSAFQAIEQSLDELFVNTTQDGLSFAIASTTWFFVEE
jgi:hypothetical protein